MLVIVPDECRACAHKKLANTFMGAVGSGRSALITVKELTALRAEIERLRQLEDLVDGIRCWTKLHDKLHAALEGRDSE